MKKKTIAEKRAMLYREWLLVSQTMKAIMITLCL